MSGAELILSKSSLESWLTCHRQWMYGYVHRVKGAPNLDMAVGTAVHSAVEAHWKAAEDPLTALAASFAREVALIPGLIPALASGALQAALGLWRTYLAKIAPTFRPTIIERDFLIRVDGTVVSGRLDAADETSVHDTKTTSTPSKVTAERHGLGMSLYGWGFRSITGHLPDKLLLDVVARNGRFAVKEVEPDYAGAAEVVGLVSRGIKAGDFEPTGAAKGECYRCPYATLCPSADLGVAPDA